MVEITKCPPAYAEGYTPPNEVTEIIGDQAPFQNEMTDEQKELYQEIIKEAREAEKRRRKHRRKWR